MTFGTRAAVVPLSVVLILLVSACRGGGGGSETGVTTGGGGGNTETHVTTGGGGNSEPGNTVYGLLAVMTDDDCTYQGDTSLGTGRFTVNVENRSQYDGAFGLAKMATAATPADVEAYLKKVRQRLKRGNLAPIAPPYTNVVTSEVGYGLVSELPANVPAGKYVLVCLQETPDALRAIYLATLLDVSE